MDNMLEKQINALNQFENNLQNNAFDQYEHLDDDFVVEEEVVVENLEEAVEEATMDIVIIANLAMDNDIALLVHQNETNQKLEHLNLDEQQSLCQMKLLELIDSNNAPLHLFDDIVKWAQTSATVNKYYFKKQPVERVLCSTVSGYQYFSVYSTMQYW
jgi:hypothetical protein